MKCKNRHILVLCHSVQEIRWYKSVNGVVSPSHSVALLLVNRTFPTHFKGVHHVKSRVPYTISNMWSVHISRVFLVCYRRCVLWKCGLHTFGLHLIQYSKVGLSGTIRLWQIPVLWLSLGHPESHNYKFKFTVMLCIHLYDFGLNVE